MENANSNIIYQKRPANLPHERWKDATPLGNGETGALVFGDVGRERIRFTRADVWDGGRNMPPPDVSDTLPRVRALMDAGDYVAANTLAAQALAEKQYGNGASAPFPLADLTLDFAYGSDRFFAYHRLLHLDTAHCEIRYRMGDHPITRTCFVSRDDGLFYMRIRSCVPISVTVVPELPAVGRRPGMEAQTAVNGDCLTLTGSLGSTAFSLACKATETDGVVVLDAAGIHVRDFTCLTVTARTAADRRNGEDYPVSDYEVAFRNHASRHGALYHRADISLSDCGNPAFVKSNEELVLDAFSTDADTADTDIVLYEKLWRFGRYLFISGTGDQPFPLYGLWAGDYYLPWAQHVANENVQIIHWHALTGNLPELIRPLIRYYYEKIPESRENARALFGCRGILVSVYSTPREGYLTPPVPVILNFTMASGWLCHHFFDYYDMTGDEETLLNQILPFAYETALFIEDFAVIRDGVLVWYPSVSPENTPREFVNYSNPLAHSMPTAQNATIELAIVRETLTRLCAIARTHGLYADKTDLWEHIIACIPAYRINGDGAVCEWQYEGLSDFYCHRHLSHLYPVFPGSEVTRTGDSHLWEAFERAVDLRELGGQSGWSFAHMAGIYARLGRGDDMLGCIDYLCRACLYDNFFTVHNDWRDNHLTLQMQEPPVQLDALMGVVNALQQMLVDDDGKAVHLFGAVPKRLRRGRASGLACRFGTFSLSWDADAGDWCATLSATRNGAVVVDCPQHPLNGAYYTLTLEVQKGMQYSLRFGNDAFCMQ